MSEERTQEATPQRIREARRKGQLPRSQELSSSVSLVIGLVVLSLGASWICVRLISYLRWNLGHLAQVTTEGAFAMMKDACLLAALAVGPAAFIMIVSSVVVQALYSGATPQFSQLKVDLERLNPLEGIKRFFTRRQVVEAARTLVKSAIFIYLGYRFVCDELLCWAPGAPRGQQALAGYFAGFWAFVWKIAVAQLVLGILDAFYQRWEFLRGLRMTKFEVKQEYKQSEGDPQVKARIRQMARKFMKARSLGAVKTANVVVTNPTHLAVALEYNLKMRAPKVVAKGADEVAKAIRRLARQHDVPIIEDKPLARALYLVEVDEDIPVDLFRAVAQILASIARVEADYAE